MTKKVDERGLLRGTGTSQISAKSFAAGFTASNYTPTQVASEGTDKISAHLKGLDTKVGTLSGATFVNELFDGNGTADTLTIVEPFTVSTPIDVFYNGQLVEESRSWQRVTANNTIQYLNEAGSVAPFPNNSRIRIRIYTANPYIDEQFNGGVSQITLANTFGNGTKIDIYVNGALKEEGNDWTRNAGSNLIQFVGGNLGDSNTRIRARIWN